MIKIDKLSKKIIWIVFIIMLLTGYIFMNQDNLREVMLLAAIFHKDVNIFDNNKIGYAYLMYDNRRELNDIAVKRLQTIKEFTELGSGFSIATRDLSIRGAGDIL